MSEQNRVTVTPPPLVGSSEPRFLVKFGDSYFLTLGVWEYNLEKSTTREQRHAFAEVASWFEKHETSGAMAKPVPPPVRDAFSGGQIK